MTISDQQKKCGTSVVFGVFEGLKSVLKFETFSNETELVDLTRIERATSYMPCKKHYFKQHHKNSHNYLISRKNMSHGCSAWGPR